MNPGPVSRQYFLPLVSGREALLSPSTWHCPRSFLISPFVWSCTWPYHRRIHLRKVWMALGRRLFVSRHWLLGTVPASNVEFYRAIFSGSLCILVALLVPETYGALLLKHRAQALSKQSQAFYVSKLDKDEQQITLGAKLKVAFSRPWLMLLHEPIVLILTIYTALLYGTVSMHPLLLWRLC